MSPKPKAKQPPANPSKPKTKQPPANISITGKVNGIGNVVGNNSQSNVSISSSQDSSSSIHASSARLLWARLFAFLLALAGILATIALFIRLLAGFESLLVIQIILAALITALGISGFLKPQMLADLLGNLLLKKR